MIILIDMDSVLADYDKGVTDTLKKQFPEKEDFFSQKKTEFKLTKQFPEFEEEINSIISKEGFIENLEPIPGCIEGIKKIIDAGHEVFICTSLHSAYENAAKEKYIWVNKYLGSEFIKRVIIAKDKTIINADYLIDDKPEITGIKTHSWKHIIFEQPHNEHITDKQKVNWQTIDSFLEKIKNTD